MRTLLALPLLVAGLVAGCGGGEDDAGVDGPSPEDVVRQEVGPARSDGLPEVGEADVDGDRAVVEVTDAFECSDGPPVEYVDTYTLTASSGQWEIDETEPYYPSDDDCISQNG